VIAATEDGVVVSLRWRDARSPKPHQLFQVLRVRDGRIIDIQDHGERRRALKAVGAPD
jgi:hypothetical protein